MADYGTWGGVASGLKELNTTGMNLLNFNAQQAHTKALEADSAARLKIAQENANQQKQAADYEQRKRVQMEAEGNAVVPAIPRKSDPQKKVCRYHEWCGI
jgi:hypothetical protein